MRTKITLTESELIGLIKKIMREQKETSHRLNLPNEVQKIERTLGKNGQFHKERKVVVLKGGGKEMSFSIPNLRLSGPGQWEIYGSSIIFSEKN